MSASCANISKEVLDKCQPCGPSWAAPIRKTHIRPPPRPTTTWEIPRERLIIDCYAAKRYGAVSPFNSGIKTLPNDV